MALFVRFVGYLSILFVCSACARGLAARGSVGGQTVETRVDSEAARYYLTSYLAGERRDAALDERIDGIYRSAAAALPDRNELKRLSDEFSIDFAALHLADRITKVSANRRFRDTFDQALAQARKGLRDGRLALPAAAAGYEVLFVPGYLYKRHPYTGADFAAPRAALQRVGVARAFLETDEDGGIEANAEIVADSIRRRAQVGKRLILVSASKSGPEVALALTQLGASGAAQVSAWVNIVGTLQGSGLADNGLWQQMEHLVGEVEIAGVESLTTARSRERFLTFRIPEHVLVVNYIGIPLTGSLSAWARGGFFELKNDGPNDGFSLLSDLIFPAGITMAELGRDHFLLDDRIDVKTLALAITVMNWLQSSPVN